MKPFVARFQWRESPPVLVIKIMEFDESLVAVVIRKDRGLDWVPVRELELDSIGLEHPIDFFKWPE